MSRKTHHVVPNPYKGGWDIRKSNAERSSGHFDRKEDAVDHAREISRNQGSELIVHNRDGRIAWIDNRSAVPFPPKKDTK
jgi:hypothetical protein